MPRKLVLLFSMMLCLIIAGAVIAQDDICPEIVEDALISMNEVCDNLGRNSICYGNTQVDATFTVDVPADYFAQPADTVPVTDLSTVQTAALNLEQNIWGVAVMNVQADLPEMLPGQAVTIVLLGDAEIQNAVAPEDAFSPAAPVTITTSAPASNIRTAPSSTAPVIGSVAGGTAFETDGQSADGQWLRIIYEGQVAWLSSTLITQNSEIATLPVIERNQYTAMQAFRFSTGIGLPTCSRAPDNIVVQGPENIDVTINANSIDITIGSTIVLKTPADNTMQVLTVSGSATVDGLTIPGGFTVSTELDETGAAIPGTLSGFRALSDDELTELAVLEEINSTLLQYQVTVPTRAEIAILQAAISNRETAITQCQAADLTQQQCLRIIGSDSNLANRIARCLSAGFSQNTCERIIGGELSATTVRTCISQGFTSAQACRAANQQEQASVLQSYCEAGGASTEDECRSYCESQGFNTLEACQTAAVSESTTGNLPERCQNAGITTEEDCQTYCQSQGYATREDCAAATTQSSGDTSSSSTTSSGTNQSQPVDFCQSIGASTQQECIQICNANGYNTLAECQAGMG